MQGKRALDSLRKFANLRGVSDELLDESQPVEIRSYFVRNRNALLVRGQFTPLYVDYYIHLAQHDLRLKVEQDTMLKEALAALTLHMTSRPWNEQAAWTLHLQEPFLNLFVCGDNMTSQVTGRIFEEDVKEAQSNLFFSQTVKNGDKMRSSVVEFEGTDMFAAAEHFYAQSEQRRGRFFAYDEEDFVFISAQPQCDLDWLEGLDAEAVRKLDQTCELSLLETRNYRFECGCNLRRIQEAIAPHCSGGAEELFGEDPSLNVSCRRCGAVYRLNREQFEAFLAAKAGK